MPAPTTPLRGIHHVTAITADARGNHDFYTRVLGLRLVKKTVNQDDTTAYHLFYADDRGSPGTDLTFFDWPAAPGTRGTNDITRTALRVAADALPYWSDRLAEAGITAAAPRALEGREVLDFEDAEGQRLRLVADDSGEAHPYRASPVPGPHQIRGLGPIELTVADPAPTAAFLTRVLLMEERPGRAEGLRVFVSPAGEGSAAELHLRTAPGNRARQGAGAVHHVAFRMDDTAYDSWLEHYASLGVRSSGPVDRFYFRSIYAREPSGILIELATDGPGFATDEPHETMGQTLALPPFLEGRRSEIERGLKPL